MISHYHHWTFSQTAVCSKTIIEPCCPQGYTQHTYYRHIIIASCAKQKHPGCKKSVRPIRRIIANRYVITTKYI